MYRKIAVAGATAAAIVGVGTAALATSGSTATNGSAQTSNSAPSAGKAAHGKNAHRKRARLMLRRGVHGSLVTKGKDGYILHSAIRGAVTAISPTSITVKASDGYSETFTLTKDTKVRLRTPGQGTTKAKTSPGQISSVKSGHEVGVLGKAAEKGSAAPTATVVVDGLKKK